MTTYSRRVSDSVSVSEMLHMRNVLGLSNGEIAQRLGCCTATVKRMIGVHPDGKRAKRKSKPLPPVVEKVPEMPRQSFRQRRVWSGLAVCGGKVLHIRWHLQCRVRSAGQYS